MEETFNRFVEELSQWHPLWVYSFLLLSAFLENVVPPVPGDTVVVFSAYLVGRGALDGWSVYLVTCAGGTAGFWAMYYVGLKRGRAFFSGRTGRFFAPEVLARAETWLERYGAWLILANRFLSGVRSVIAFSAGIGAMRWNIVVGCGLLSMAVWNGILLYAGLLVGQNWEEVSLFLRQYNRVMIALLLGGGLLWGLVRWRGKKRQP